MSETSDLLGFFSPEEFKRLLAEKTNGMAPGPDLAEQVSLLPITSAEAGALRGQVMQAQKGAIQASALAAQAKQSADAATATALLARNAADATRMFSERILALEFQLSRALTALTVAGVEVDLTPLPSEPSVGFPDGRTAEPDGRAVEDTDAR